MADIFLSFEALKLLVRTNLSIMSTFALAISRIRPTSQIKCRAVPSKSLGETAFVHQNPPCLTHPHPALLQIMFVTHLIIFTFIAAFT